MMYYFIGIECVCPFLVFATYHGKIFSLADDTTTASSSSISEYSSGSADISSTLFPSTAVTINQEYSTKRLQKSSSYGGISYSHSKTGHKSTLTSTNKEVGTTKGHGCISPEKKMCFQGSFNTCDIYTFLVGVAVGLLIGVVTTCAACCRCRPSERTPQNDPRTSRGGSIMQHDRIKSSPGSCHVCLPHGPMNHAGNLSPNTMSRHQSVESGSVFMVSDHPAGKNLSPQLARCPVSGSATTPATDNMCVTADDLYAKVVKSNILPPAPDGSHVDNLSRRQRDYLEDYQDINEVQQGDSGVNVACHPEDDGVVMSPEMDCIYAQVDKSTKSLSVSAASVRSGY